MNDEINSMLEGITLCSDPPEHTQMRSVLSRPLRPDQLRELTPRVEAEASRIVEQLVSRGTSRCDGTCRAPAAHHRV